MKSMIAPIDLEEGGLLKKKNPIMGQLIVVKNSEG
jgi:hypothetical protein